MSGGLGVQATHSPRQGLHGPFLCVTHGPVEQTTPLDLRSVEANAESSVDRDRGVSLHRVQIDK